MSKTTERDFQRRLDENPNDQGVRLTFADYLEEQGSVRALGYRALGLMNRIPGLSTLPIRKYRDVVQLQWNNDQYLRMGLRELYTTMTAVWFYDRWLPQCRSSKVHIFTNRLPYDWWRKLMDIQERE